MGSSKKKGQQRKAAAKRAQSAETMASSIINSSVSSGDAISGGSNSKIVAKVRRGNNYATKKLSFTSQFNRFRAAEMLAERGFRNLSYEQSGILSIVLDFLNWCEDDTFHQVVSSVGGDLKSPASWIDILVSACIAEPGCTLQIVENISPLVRCMCNDTERQLFKSNKHWKQGIVSFVNLITNVTEYNVYEDKKVIVEALLQHEGLLTSIVQWGCWKDHRPDIVKELKSEGITVNVIAKICNNATGMVEWLIDGTELLEKESKYQLLDTIGTASVISKEYNTSCMVSYTYGLVRGLHAVAEMARPLTTEEESRRDTLFSIIQSLILHGVSIITDMIDLGLNYAPKYTFALNVTVLSFRMTQGTIENELRLNADSPSDTRIATAIRAGLIEMCLGFIEQFEKHESFKSDELLSMHGLIRSIFKSISKVSLHQKTAKAIRHQKGSIVEKLMQVHITNKSESKKLLEMVRSILDMNGSYCCRCNKSLSRTEVKLCNGCGCMTYCSSECQRDDWLNGHKLSCCTQFTDDKSGQFQGTVIPILDNARAAAKLHEIEININMIQLKLFLDHSETILSQASSLDIPLYDCIVKFELRHCPPTIEVKKYTEFYDNFDEQMLGFVDSRSRDNIICVYYSQIYSGELKDCVAIQRLFPHEWIMKQNK